MVSKWTAKRDAEGVRILTNFLIVNRRYYDIREEFDLIEVAGREARLKQRGVSQKPDFIRDVRV